MLPTDRPVDNPKLNPARARGEPAFTNPLSRQCHSGAENSFVRVHYPRSNRWLSVTLATRNYPSQSASVHLVERRSARTRWPPWSLPHRHLPVRPSRLLPRRRGLPVRALRSTKAAFFRDACSRAATALLRCLAEVVWVKSIGLTTSPSASPSRLSFFPKKR